MGDSLKYKKNKLNFQANFLHNRIGERTVKIKASHKRVGGSGRRGPISKKTFRSTNIIIQNIKNFLGYNKTLTRYL